MGQVMPMSWRLTEVGNSLFCQLIRFLDSIQAQQTKACLLGHLRRLELHVVTLKDSTASIEEEQCLTIMPLSRINQSDVQFLPSHRNLLSLVTGKRCTGLIILPRFVVYDGSIHINLPGAQVLSIAYKDFACCRGIT